MLPYPVVLVYDVDGSVDGDARQEDERGKTALVEVEFEPVEGEEDADEGYGDDEDDDKRLFE